MNFYSLIGLLLAMAVLAGGLFLSTRDVTIFLDQTSAFIVLGGTLAAVSISFQLNKIVVFLKIFIIRVLRNGKIDHRKTIVDIIKTSEKFKAGMSLEALAKEVEEPIISEGLQMVADEMIERDTILNILDERVENLYIHYSEDTSKFKSLGKYPPAFGMMGTTMGMIVLLANLGGPDAIEMIGPAMGVCLITTLYGVVIANLIIIPIAENLDESTKEAYLKNKIALRGFSLIIEKSSPMLIAEELNSFLKPGDRLQWKEIVGKK
jgi:chemotaxis protein MotA